jgi:hypothetical protein
MAKAKTRPKGATAAVNLGLNFAVGMALLSYLGHKLDEKLGGGTTWTLCGLFLGLTYGGYEVWKLVRNTNADDQDERE